MIIDRLVDAIRQCNNPTVVGLDTCVDYLPLEMQQSLHTTEDARKAIVEFNCGIIDKVHKYVPAVKVQIAYYEMYGVDGIRAFEETIKYASSRNLVVMSDAKRNDIGSTAKAYSNAFLGKTTFNGEHLTAFNSDFLTVNGYLGVDGIAPFIEDCKASDKGIFVLVKTSNPSSGQLQDLQLASGKTVYMEMAGLVSEWGKDLIGTCGFSSVGAVVGATHPNQAAALREQFPSMFFLVPGYGAQGGSAKDVAVNFNGKGQGAIVNSSRGILCAYKQAKYKGQTFASAALSAVLDMQSDINAAVGR